MNTTVVPTWHPWHERPIEIARALLARLTTAAAGMSSIDALDARTLRDIGVDGSELASIRAEASGAAAVTRLRIVVGQGHV